MENRRFYDILLFHFSLLSHFLINPFRNENKSNTIKILHRLTSYQVGIKFGVSAIKDHYKSIVNPIFY